MATLFVKERSRNKIPRALVKHYKLDYQIVDNDEELAKYFPLKLIPALLEKDGFKLTETIAVSVYRMYFIDQL